MAGLERMQLEFRVHPPTSAQASESSTAATGHLFTRFCNATRSAGSPPLAGVEALRRRSTERTAEQTVLYFPRGSAVLHDEFKSRIDQSFAYLHCRRVALQAMLR